MSNAGSSGLQPSAVGQTINCLAHPTTGSPFIEWVYTLKYFEDFFGVHRNR